MYQNYILDYLYSSLTHIDHLFHILAHFSITDSSPIILEHYNSLIHENKELTVNYFCNVSVVP